MQDNLLDSIEDLWTQLKEYSETRIRLAKLEVADRLSDVVSSLFAGILFLVFFFMFFTLLNIVLALWLGKLMGNYFYGFLSLGGFYFILWLLLVIAGKKALKKYFAG